MKLKWKSGLLLHGSYVQIDIIIQVQIDIIIHVFQIDIIIRNSNLWDI